MNTIPSVGKKAAILGLGISGMESALFLNAKGFEVFASDGGLSPALSERVLQLEAKGIHAECGRHTLDKIMACDWAVISPGIPPTAPVYHALRSAGKPIFSEIEVASWFCPTNKIIAVTGSSGKTTVTTLISRVIAKNKRLNSNIPARSRDFESPDSAGRDSIIPTRSGNLEGSDSAGRDSISPTRSGNLEGSDSAGKTFLCGNIGNPWIGELSKIKAEDFVVLELSSFQLAHCEKFRPQIGILLNLSPNHQDWHPDMRDYASAKLRIFQNQQAGDYAIYRQKDRNAFFPDFKFNAQQRCFDLNSGANPNEDVVRLTAEILGYSSESVDEVVAEFEGIEHRLEKIAFSGGVTFINDSKCTTTASLAWALEKFPDGKVLLLAGGHPKSNDFADIRELVSRKVKKAFLIGEAQPLLREAWKGACAMTEPADFECAVTESYSQAVAGDVVLLSPACASFDMFKNYIERGLFFKKMIGLLTQVTASGNR